MGTLGVKERGNGRTIRVNLRTLDEEVLGNLLIGNDDELGSQHASAVNGTIHIGPLLELEPHVVDGQIVDTAYDGQLCWPRHLDITLGGILAPRDVERVECEGNEAHHERNVREGMHAGLKRKKKRGVVSGGGKARRCSAWGCLGVEVL